MKIQYITHAKNEPNYFILLILSKFYKYRYNLKPKIKEFLSINSTEKAYQAFQVLRLLTTLIITSIFVKLNFTTSETSAYELFIFVASIGSFFWIIGLSNAMLSFFPKLDEVDKKSFFKSIFITFQFFGIILAILLYFTNGFGLILKNSLIDKQILLLISIYTFFYAPIIIVEIKYILTQAKNSLIKYGIIIYGFQLIIILTAIYLKHNILYTLLGLTVWIFLRWIWTIFVVFNGKNSYVFNLKIQKTFLIFSLPLIAHILLGNGMDYIDGILVEMNFDESMFAIYKYGSKEFPIILILIGALRSVMIPTAVKDTKLAASNIRSKTEFIIWVFFPIAILLIFTSKYIFTYVYNVDYIYSALLFNIYLLIISSRIILSEVFIYAKHKNNVLMYVSFVEFILNIILSLILLKYYGIAGIAFATFISFLSSKLFLVFYAHKNLGIPLSKYINIKVYSIFTILLYLSFYISTIISQ